VQKGPAGPACSDNPQAAGGIGDGYEAPIHQKLTFVMNELANLSYSVLVSGTVPEPLFRSLLCIDPVLPALDQSPCSHSSPTLGLFAHLLRSPASVVDEARRRPWSVFNHRKQDRISWGQMAPVSAKLKRIDFYKKLPRYPAQHLVHGQQKRGQHSSRLCPAASSSNAAVDNQYVASAVTSWRGRWQELGYLCWPLP
jgi:hypothetical protein